MPRFSILGAYLRESSKHKLVAVIENELALMPSKNYIITVKLLVNLIDN